MSKESEELTKQIKTLNKSVEILAKVTAISVGKETIFKGKERKEEKLKVLDDIGLPDEIIALLIGSTPESVQVIRSQQKKKAKVAPAKAEPQPQEAQKDDEQRAI